MKTPALILAFLVLTNGVRADTRVSANYSIATEIADAGGARSASANYNNSGSVGGVTGPSTTGASGEVAKSGYLGQIYDVVSGIFVVALPATINEGGTRQLTAALNLDDGTGLALGQPTVTWSVLGGPITSISADGVASAGTVYQDTAASVQGVANGFTASLPLTVQNVNTDDFGSYAGDGLDDAWQVHYFGLDNPNAAPSADPDHDGQTNLFEFTAGLVPTDPTSHFNLTIGAAGAQSTQHSIVFSPLVAGRSYTVQFKNGLNDPTWQTLVGATQNDNGTTRTVTDTTPAPARFYRVQIGNP